MIENDYFEWLYDKVFDRRFMGDDSYCLLLRYLHDIEFRYDLPMDENRAMDGVDLRYRFGYESGMGVGEVQLYLDLRSCTLLEMLVALALRCEEAIMADVTVGDRTGQWFWTMIKSIGLMDMSDDQFEINQSYVEETVNKLLDREYERDGRGGYFTLPNHTDMRHAEIWYQLCWYLTENYDI